VARFTQKIRFPPHAKMIAGSQSPAYTGLVTLLLERVAGPCRVLASHRLTGIGIAELMDEAGLTVGGFYKHFASRDDLVAEAMRSASGEWKRKLNAAASGGSPITFEFLVDDYLSEAHRDHPGTGCPVSALSADSRHRAE
jgi:AcrR family transcriptional regulator